MTNIAAGSVIWKLDADASDFESKLDKAQKSTNDFGDDVDRQSKRASSSFAEIAKDALAFVGIASVLGTIKNAVFDAVTAFGDFESNLGVLKTVTQATNPQLEQLKALATELGKDLTLPGVSASDAAQAMLELGKAGIGVNDILGASKAVLQAAKAGNIGVADSAAIVAQAMSAFSIKGGEAIKVADLLAGAANASAFDIDQVGLALSQASASAAIAGVPLNDTVTAISALGNAGLQASDAGTSLKSFFRTIAPTTKPAIDAMKNLGLSFFDSSGQFVGLRESSSRLQAALKGLSEQQKLVALDTIFGSDASRTAAVLANQGAEGFDKLSGAVNRQGAAADLARARNEGIKGSIDALKSAIDTALLGFGEFISGGLKPLIDFAASNLPVALAAVGGAIGGIGLAAAAATIGVGGLVTLLATLGTITGIGLLIGAVAAFIVFLQQRFNIFGAILEGLKTIFDTVKDAVVGFVDGAIKKFKEFMASPIGEFIKNTFAAIGDAINTAKDIILESFDNINKSLQPVRDAFDQFVIAVKPAIDFLGELWGQIQGPVMEALKVVGIAFAVLLIAPLALIAAGIAAVIAIGVLLVISIVKIIEIIVAVGAKFIELHTKIFTAVIEAIKNVINWFGNIANSARDRVNDVIKFFRELPDKILGALGNFGSLLTNVGRDLISGLTKGITGAASTAVDAVKNVGSNVVNGFKSFFGIKSPSTVMARQGDFLMQGLANGILNGQGMVDSAIGNINTDLGAFNTTASNLAPAVASAAGTQGGEISINFYGQVDLSSDQKIDDVATRLARQLNAARAGSF